MSRQRPTFTRSPWAESKALADGTSGRWAFMRKFEVPDYDDPDRNYLTRYRLLQTPLFSLYLHRLDGPDPRPTLHDHPWSFVSLVLRGGYEEVRAEGAPKIVRRFNVVRLGQVHYIERLLRTPTWTLLLVGRRQRVWGYVRPTSNGYQWSAFDEDEHAVEFDKAMRARRGELPAAADLAAGTVVEDVGAKHYGDRWERTGRGWYCATAWPDGPPPYESSYIGDLNLVVPEWEVVPQSIVGPKIGRWARRDPSTPRFTSKANGGPFRGILRED